MHSMFENTCSVSTFSTMKQVKSRNKNGMADETPNQSLWLAPGIDEGTIAGAANPRRVVSRAGSGLSLLKCFGPISGLHT